MRLELEQLKRIERILGECEYEHKDSSITFKCSDINTISRLIVHGHVSIRSAKIIMDLMNKYNATVYGSILREYNNLPVELGGIRCENVTLEMCEELNELFNLVMPYPNGTVVWLGLKE